MVLTGREIPQVKRLVLKRGACKDGCGTYDVDWGTCRVGRGRGPVPATDDRVVVRIYVTGNPNIVNLHLFLIDLDDEGYGWAGREVGRGDEGQISGANANPEGVKLSQCSAPS